MRAKKCGQLLGKEERGHRTIRGKGVQRGEETFYTEKALIPNSDIKKLGVVGTLCPKEMNQRRGLKKKNLWGSLVNTGKERKERRGEIMNFTTMVGKKKGGY